MTLHWPPPGEMNKPTQTGVYYQRDETCRDGRWVYVDFEISSFPYPLCYLVNHFGPLSLKYFTGLPNCQFAGPIEWPKEHEEK